MPSAPKYFRSSRIPVLLLAFFCVAAGKDGEDDAKALFRRASRSALDTIERLPKYVCTLTVDRFEYEPDRAGYGRSGEYHSHSCDGIAAEVKAGTWYRRLIASDRLRLDVAVNRQPSGVQDEMYSWVGADHFSDRSLFDLIPDGALSTGSFASMLTSIFGRKTSRFSYLGDSTVKGTVLSEFGFRVPVEESEYLYLYGLGRRQQAVIPYDGSFLVDPATSDIVRLVTHAGDLPAESGACELTQVFDYGRVRLDGADFLLPNQVRLLVTHMDARQAENVVHFSSCHEFKGESTVRFAGAEEPGIAPAAARPAALALPPGLPFRLVFTDRIDPAVAAAGDPVRARLETPIRDRSSKVLVPQGSAVTGRILSIKRFYGPGAGSRKARQRPSLMISIRLETVELAGDRRTFETAFDSALRRFSKTTGTLSREVEIGSPDVTQDPGTGIFEFWDMNPSYVVESGLQSNWFTR